MPDREDVPLELRFARLVDRCDLADRKAAALERDVRILARRLAAVGKTVDGMKLQEEVQAGINKALRERTPQVAQATADRVSAQGAPLVLTWPQKIGGGIAAAILVIDAFRGLIS